MGPLLLDYSKWFWKSAAVVFVSAGNTVSKSVIIQRIIINRTRHKTPLLIMVHTCQTCGKTFVQKSNLKTHQILVHNAAEKRYKCETCDQKYYRKCDLRIHEKTHSNLRLYKCEKCSLTLKTRDILTGHMKIHGAKKFNAPFVEINSTEKTA